MKIRMIALALAQLIAVPSVAQSRPANQAILSNNPSITGVWRGQMGNLPVVTLTITDEGGGLSGAVLFYLLKRQDVNQPLTASPGTPEPLFSLKFDGKKLAFDMSHRRAHPPGSLSDPPVSFHLTLTGPDKAELVNEHEGPPIAMTRADY
jgi:hypothetical protein